MTQQNKLTEKIRRPNSNWVWSELCALLIGLGYRQLQGSGSRVKFDNGDALGLINLHRPHPDKEVKSYVIAQVREKLHTGGLI